jgi:hypothetical protein
MSIVTSTLQNSSELNERVCAIQLQVFRGFFIIFCTVPCLLVATHFMPELISFMTYGRQTSSMTVMKLLVLVPIVAVFIVMGYLAVMLAAIGNVLIIRLSIPQVSRSDTHIKLMQFYSHPRWVNFLWGGMKKNKRLTRWYRRLTKSTIILVYGESD